MTTRHVKVVRCLVWHMALQYWNELRGILFAKMESRICRLFSMLYEVKRLYKLLNEPDVKMTKSYKVADYYHEIARQAAKRRTKNKSEDIVTEQQNAESTEEEQDGGIAALCEYICTGEDSKDELELFIGESPNKKCTGTGEPELQCSGSHSATADGSSASDNKRTGTDGPGQQSSELLSEAAGGSSAPKKKLAGKDKPEQQSGGTHDASSSGASAPNKKRAGNVESGQQSGGSQSAPAGGSSASNKKCAGKDDPRQHSSRSQSAASSGSFGSNKKGTETDEPGQQSSPSSSGASVPKEKYTGTKPKIVKRPKKQGKELVSASNIEVPHTPENCKKSTAEQDFSQMKMNEKNDIEDEKNLKNKENKAKKKGKLRDTDNGKICATTPPPRKKEPPPAGAGLDDDGKDNEDDKGPTPPPRYNEQLFPLDLSKKTGVLGENELAPELPEVDYDTGILEMYTNLHNELELISKLDPAMRRCIGRAFQDDVKKHIDEHQLVIDGVEWVKLGKVAKVKKDILWAIDWTESGIEIARHLLVNTFDVETLETHNRTGGSKAGLPGDIPISDMPTLDIDAVTDLVNFMFTIKGQKLEDTRKVIDEVCDEHFNAKLEREQQERDRKWLMHFKSKKAKKPQRKHGRRR